MFHLGFRAAKYISEVEREYLGQNQGYEQWFRKQTVNETIAYTIVWGVVLLLALLVAVFQPTEVGAPNAQPAKVAEAGVSGAGCHAFAAHPSLHLNTQAVEGRESMLSRSGDSHAHVPS